MSQHQVNTMFELEKTFRFEAGHVLAHHDGKCKIPHGHSYVLTVRVRSPKLQTEGPKRNMVIDFQDISSIVKPLVKEKLDHCWLNDSLETDSPTVEYIALWIFNQLKEKIQGLHSVTLQETESCKVTYYIS